MRKREKVGPRIERRVGGKWVSTPLDVRPDPDDPDSLLLVLHKEVIGRMTKAPAAVAASDNVKKLLERAERKRLIEDIAEAVASPLDIRTDPDHLDGYLLVEHGKLVAKWREPDHPGLAAWIATKMHERRSALLLARFEASLAYKQSARGKQSGKSAKRDPAARHSELARLIRNALKRGENPRQYVPEWLRAYKIGRTALYALIKRLELAHTK